MSLICPHCQKSIDPYRDSAAAPVTEEVVRRQRVKDIVRGARAAVAQLPLPSIPGLLSSTLKYLWYTLSGFVIVITWVSGACCLVWLCTYGNRRLGAWLIAHIYHINFLSKVTDSDIGAQCIVGATTIAAPFIVYGLIIWFHHNGMPKQEKLD
jgi:hypothetical protein